MKQGLLIWRNLTRNVLRTGLTGAAIALAVALVCVLLTMPAAFDALIENSSSNTRVSVHARAGLVYSIPLAYQQKVRSMPGVVETTSYDWFGGAVDADDGVTFPNFAVDADKIGEVFADYRFDPAHLEDFVRYRDGALAAEALLQRYGWEVGDRITLESTRYGFPLEFQIVGLINLPSSSGNPMLWFNRVYLEQTLEGRGEDADTMNMIWARVDDPSRVEPLMAEIDALFRNSEVPTASETEKSFVMNFIGVLEGLVTVVLIVTGVVALCIVFIAANTASMAVRERVGELAILKALGFSRRSIFAALFSEALLLSTAAGGAGVFLALGLSAALRAAGQTSMQLGPIGSFAIGPWVVVQGLFLALFVGMLSGIVPSWGAARRGVVETLREVF